MHVIILLFNLSVATKKISTRYTVKPEMSHISKEFIKCGLKIFSMGFIPFYHLRK